MRPLAKTSAASLNIVGRKPATLSTTSLSPGPAAARLRSSSDTARSAVAPLATSTGAGVAAGRSSPRGNAGGGFSGIGVAGRCAAGLAGSAAPAAAATAPAAGLGPALRAGAVTDRSAFAAGASNLGAEGLGSPPLSCSVFAAYGSGGGGG
eukprot:2951606-Alexandrium_andersonii.AAC.1